MGKQPENSKKYKTAAILFAVGGFILIILGIADIIYLPIGIALIIISFAIWQRRES